jgi:molybdopterin-guanine dinucleotide biosynthesis protein A
MGGGDKCLRPLGAGTILDEVILRARPQVAALLLNANGDPGRFAGSGLPVAADVVAGFAGPLAGVLTGMAWARAERPELPWIATIATDTPFFPLDLVARLLAAIECEGAELACAASAGRAHPVFGLWPVRLMGELRRAMQDEDLRKVDVWTARYRLAVVEFRADPFDPFFNANRPDDLAEAERLLARRQQAIASSTSDRA